MKQKEKELNKANKKLKLLEKGSADYKKQLKVINHIFTKIMNKRKDFSHKESRKLVDRFGLIVFEDLDIQSMLKANPRSLNDKILDVGWGKFVSNTEYKAKEAGRGFILIDPRNTSKLCSTCGTLVSKSLSTRIHNCPNCGLTIDRDLNASYNILARGLASL
jgi:putative transposase